MKQKGTLKRLLIIILTILMVVSNQPNMVFASETQKDSSTIANTEKIQTATEIDLEDSSVKGPALTIEHYAPQPTKEEIADDKSAGQVHTLSVSDVATQNALLESVQRTDESALNFYKAAVFDSSDAHSSRLTTLANKILSEYATKNSLTASKMTDLQKVQAAHDWVASHVYYDYDTYYGARKDQTAAGVLDSYSYDTANSSVTNDYNRRYIGVCEGYANLAEAIIRTYGIPAKSAMGQASGTCSDSDYYNWNVDHAWNYVYLDKNGDGSKEWMFMDVTWDSPNTYSTTGMGGKKIGYNSSSNSVGQTYFNCSSSTMSSRHRIVTIEEENLPSLYTVDSEGKVTIPAGTKVIPAYSFYQNKQIKEITIPDSVEVIGYCAFWNCSIQKLNLPKNLKYVSYYGFAYDNSLQSLTMNNSENYNNGYYQVSDGAFYDKNAEYLYIYASKRSAKTVNINDTTKTIMDGAFRSSNLEEVTIPDSVTSIGLNCFNASLSLKQFHVGKNCSLFNWCVLANTYALEKITVDADNNAYTSIDGALFTKNKSQLRKLPDNWNHSSSIYNLPVGITSLFKASIQNCKFGVSVPPTVTAFGNSTTDHALNNSGIFYGITGSNIETFAKTVLSNATFKTVPQIGHSISGLEYLYPKGYSAKTLDAKNLIDAAGFDFTYQWYQSVSNSNTSGTKISGATSSSYTPSTTSEGTIYYYVELTSTDGKKDSTTTVGKVVSEPVKVEVQDIQSALENLDYTVTYQEVTNEKEAMQAVKDKINEKLNIDLGLTVTKKAFTTSIPGDKTNHKGTDGSYQFTITATNGSIPVTTKTLTMKIIAKEYGPLSVVEDKLEAGYIYPVSIAEGMPFSLSDNYTLIATFPDNSTVQLTNDNLNDYGIVWESMKDKKEFIPNQTVVTKDDIDSNNYIYCYMKYMYEGSYHYVTFKNSTSPVSFRNTIYEPQTLPEATVGKTYSYTIENAYWYMSRGTLPPGLTTQITSSGTVISGTPTESNKNGYLFIGTLYPSGTSAYKIVVNPAPEIKKYTLSYNAGGGLGTSPDSNTLEAGKTIILPSNPYSKSNCTFTGWNDGTKTYAAGASYTMPAKDIILTAQWIVTPITKYTLAYSGDSGASGTAPPSQSLAAGTVINLPNNTYTKTDYTFSGWSDGTKTYSAGTSYTMPAKNITLTAQWTPIPKFTLSYNANGGTGTSPASQSLAAGKTITLPNNPYTKSGYTFAGWSDGYNIYNALASYTMPTKNIILTAQWAPVTKYILAYNANGGTGNAPTNESLVEGTTIKLANNTYTKTGYTFAGWSDGSNTYAAGAMYTMPARNITLTAQWIIVITKYTLTYSGGEDAIGNTPSSQSLAKGATIILANNPYMKFGYTFTGWSDGIRTYAAGASYTMPANNVTLTAQWEVIPLYTLNYSGGDGVTGNAPDSQSLAQGDTIRLPSNPYTKEGYTFAGWSDGFTTYRAGANYTMPAKNVTLTAQWNLVSITEYTLRYSGGSGATGNTPDDETLAAGTTIILEDNPYTKSGYTFIGWSDGTRTYLAGTSYTMPAKNITLTAQWEKNKGVVVTDDYNDETVYTSLKEALNAIQNDEDFEYNTYSIDIKQDEKLENITCTIPENVDIWIWDGYTLTLANTSKVTVEGCIYNMQSTVINNGELILKGDDYSYSFYNTGLFDTSNGKTYGKEYYLDGYGAVLKGDFIIETVTKYILSYNTGESSSSSPISQSLEKGTIITLPDNPYTKTGYTFVGWSDGTKTYAAGESYTMPANNVTLTAQWEAISKYNLTYNAGGGTGTPPASRSLEEGTVITLPNNPYTKSGYTFTGWNDGTKTYTAGQNYTMPNKDVTFTAQWKEISKYNLTYNAGGGTGTPPASRSLEEGTVITLPNNPYTKSGYTFTGWNDGTKTYSAGQNYTMPNKDVTFTAQWKKNNGIIVDDETVYSSLKKALDAIQKDEFFEYTDYGIDIEQEEILDNTKLTIPENVTVWVNEGYTLTIANTSELVIEGGLINEGTVLNNGKFTLKENDSIFTFYNEGLFDTTNGKAYGEDYYFAEDNAVLKGNFTVEEVTKYTLTYSGGSGSSGTNPPSQRLEEGTVITLPNNPYKKTNYTFTGWSDGTKTYAALASYTMPKKDVTFTAQWKQLISTPALTKLENTTTGVKITLQTVSNAKGYTILRKTGSGSYTKLDTSTSSTYTDKTAKSGTTYTYKINAYNGSVISTSSKEKSIKYLSTPAVSSISNTFSGIKISWGKISGASNYRIYRKTSSGYSELLDTSSTTYTDKTAKSGTTYTYTIKALSGSTYSAYNTTGKTIKYLSKPAISSLSNTSSGIKITWKKISGASGYIIKRNGTTIKTITSGSTITYTDSKAKTNGSKYSYTVQAISGSTKSEVSSSYTNYYLSTPKTPSASNTSAKKMTVKWSSNSKATGYEIKYSTSKSFSSSKTVKVTPYKTVSKVISSLSKGRTYYVCLRSYKTVSKKSYYSSWSSTKYVKIKK